MTKKKNALLKKTIETWQPDTQKKLGKEDAREIIANMTGFISVLKEWEQNDHEKGEDIYDG